MKTIAYLFLLISVFAASAADDKEDDKVENKKLLRQLDEDSLQRAVQAKNSRERMRALDQLSITSEEEFGAKDRVVVFLLDDEFLDTGEPTHGLLMLRCIQKHFSGEVIEKKVAQSDFDLNQREEKITGEKVAIALEEVEKYMIENPRTRILVNMSWGYYDPAAEMWTKCLRMARSGGVFVAAAGNDGRETCNYPAAHAFVIGVGAARRTGYQVVKTDYTNYGREVDVAVLESPSWVPESPSLDLEIGFDIRKKLRTKPSALDSHPSRPWPIRYHGTSIAAALVSGWCANILSMKPDLKRQDLLHYAVADDRAHGFSGFVQVVDFKDTKSWILKYEK